jgi:hypothetical protein
MIKTFGMLEGVVNIVLPNSVRMQEDVLTYYFEVPSSTTTLCLYLLFSLDNLCQESYHISWRDSNQELVGAF